MENQEFDSLLVGPRGVELLPIEAERYPSRAQAHAHGEGDVAVDALLRRWHGGPGIILPVSNSGVAVLTTSASRRLYNYV